MRNYVKMFHGIRPRCTAVFKSKLPLILHLFAVIDQPAHHLRQRHPMLLDGAPTDVFMAIQLDITVEQHMAPILGQAQFNFPTVQYIRLERAHSPMQDQRLVIHRQRLHPGTGGCPPPPLPTCPARQIRHAAAPWHHEAPRNNPVRPATRRSEAMLRHGHR